MMQDLLRKYLSSGHTFISLPGLGTIASEETSARIDFPNHLLYPPGFTITYSVEQKDNHQLINWIEQEEQINADEASAQIHAIAVTLRYELNHNAKTELKGIGSFIRNEDGQLIFAADESLHAYLAPVHAGKIIRQDAEHTIRVGEDEKTNTEMQELLSAGEPKLSYKWWMGALALLVLAVVILWLFASGHAAAWRIQGNDQKINAKEMPVLHQAK
jgi:hypothetical protein